MAARHRPGSETPETMRAGALAAVDARLVQCKHRISLAALACLRGALDAPELVRRALEEVEGARAALAEAEGGGEP
ncbi:MAG: hypothetical protein ABI423_09085 [Burkholderiales bacterium]